MYKGANTFDNTCSMEFKFPLTHTCTSTNCTYSVIIVLFFSFLGLYNFMNFITTIELH